MKDKSIKIKYNKPEESQPRQNLDLREITKLINTVTVDPRTTPEDQPKKFDQQLRIVAPAGTPTLFCVYDNLNDTWACSTLTI